MPAACQRGAAGRELVGEPGDPQPGDRRADLGERLTGQRLDLGQLGLGALGVDVDEPLGELGLDRDHGERVTEHVVHVAGHPFPLGHQRRAPGGSRSCSLATLLEHPHGAGGRADEQHDHDEEPGTGVLSARRPPRAPGTMPTRTARPARTQGSANIAKATTNGAMPKGLDADDPRRRRSQRDSTPTTSEARPPVRIRADVGLEPDEAMHVDGGEAQHHARREHPPAPSARRG